MNKVRIGVIGIGNIGSVHALNIYQNKIKGAVLSAVCDINTGKLDWVKENLNGVSVFSDYKALIDSGEAEAVIIATPHYYHPIMAMYAFEKGLHVLSEKPAGVYTEIVEQLNETAKKSGRKFAIMYNQRTDPLFSKAREIFRSGDIGELKRVVWIITNWYRNQIYYRSSSWRATWSGEGGGVLANQCPHNIDILQWIVGMPVSVSGHCGYGKYHDIEVEDDVTAYFEYENGATGVFITSTGEFPGTNRLEISGTKGKMIIENGKISVWKLNISEREFVSFDNDEFSNIKCTFSEFVPPAEERPFPHNIIIQNFVNSILNDEELISPGFEGIKGLSVTNAIHMSDWLNKKVSIPPDGKLYKKILDLKIQNSFKSGEVVKDSSVTMGKSSDRWNVKW